jgi:hypothetical protein
MRHQTHLTFTRSLTFSRRLTFTPHSYSWMVFIYTFPYTFATRRIRKCGMRHQTQTFDVYSTAGAVGYSAHFCVGVTVGRSTMKIKLKLALQRWNNQKKARSLSFVSTQMAL